MRRLNHEEIMDKLNCLFVVIIFNATFCSSGLSGQENPKNASDYACLGILNLQGDKENLAAVVKSVYQVFKEERDEKNFSFDKFFLSSVLSFNNPTLTKEKVSNYRHYNLNKNAKELKDYKIIQKEFYDFYSQNELKVYSIITKNFQKLDKSNLKNNPKESNIVQTFIDILEGKGSEQEALIVSHSLLSAELERNLTTKSSPDLIRFTSEFLPKAIKIALSYTTYKESSSVQDHFIRLGSLLFHAKACQLNSIIMGNAKKQAGTLLGASLKELKDILLKQRAKEFDIDSLTPDEVIVLTNVLVGIAKTHATYLGQESIDDSFKQVCEFSLKTLTEFLPADMTKESFLQLYQQDIPDHYKNIVGQGEIDNQENALKPIS